MPTKRLSAAASPAAISNRIQRGYVPATIVAVETASASTVQVMIEGKVVTAKPITDDPFVVGDGAWATWTPDGWLVTGSQ